MEERVAYATYAEHEQHVISTGRKALQSSRICEQQEQVCTCGYVHGTQTQALVSEHICVFFLLCSLRLPALPGSPAASTPLSSTSKSDSHTVIIRRSLSSESHKNERKTSQFPPISRKAIPSPQPIQHRRSISDKVAQRRPSKVSSHATASPAVSSKRPAAAAPAAKDVSNVMRQRAEHLAKMKTVYVISKYCVFQTLGHMNLQLQRPVRLVER